MPSSIQNSWEPLASTKKGISVIRLSCPCHLGFIACAAPGDYSDQPFSVFFGCFSQENLSPCLTSFSPDKEAKRVIPKCFFLSRGLGKAVSSHRFNIFMQWDNNTCGVLPAGSVSWWWPSSHLRLNPYCLVETCLNLILK